MNSNVNDSIRWIEKFWIAEDGPPGPRKMLCPEAWKRFLYLCDYFDFDVDTRIQILNRTSRTNYFRWGRFARAGIPFQATLRMNWLCLVLDILEAIATRSPSRQECKDYLTTELRRKPNFHQSPLSILLRSEWSLNWWLLQILTSWPEPNSKPPMPIGAFPKVLR